MSGYLQVIERVGKITAATGAPAAPTTATMKPPARPKTARKTRPPHGPLRPAATTPRAVDLRIQSTHPRAAATAIRVSPLPSPATRMPITPQSTSAAQWRRSAAFQSVQPAIGAAAVVPPSHGAEIRPALDSVARAHGRRTPQPPTNSPMAFPRCRLRSHRRRRAGFRVSARSAPGSPPVTELCDQSRHHLAGNRSRNRSFPGRRCG